MDNMIGKKFMVSGMALKIVSDADDSWETQNITTKETIFMNKLVLLKAIKLGKAEEI